MNWRSKRVPKSPSACHSAHSGGGLEPARSRDATLRGPSLHSGCQSTELSKSGLGFPKPTAEHRDGRFRKFVGSAGASRDE